MEFSVWSRMRKWERVGLAGLSSIYLVQGPPKNTEHVSKIFHVVVVALEEQVFPPLYQTHQSWSHSKFWNLQRVIQIIMGKNSLVLGFWCLELYAGRTSRAGKAAPTPSSWSSVIQSLFTLNYRNSEREGYRKTTIICARWSKDFNRCTWFPSNTHCHLPI